jgi:seryl-tRNA synthetase
MLDIQFIRNHPELVQQVADQKRLEVSITDLLAMDETRRELIQRVEPLRRERNEISKQMAQMSKNGSKESLEQLKQKGRDINAALSELEAALTASDTEFHRMMLLVPNVVSADTPIGSSDKDNVELKRVGTPPVFDFEAKDHVQLGEAHDLFDIPRGVKVAGTRNYYLKGAGLHLHRAVQQLAVDLLHQRGFTVMDVPVLVREETLRHTGFFPTGREQTYELPHDNKWLVGTSEASLVSYYSDEIIEVTEPIRLAAVSNCFRREAGSAGRDVRGLYRVHQFAKVEQVVICRNDADEAERQFREITNNAEELLQLLELPYRVVAVCTGDMGQKNYKQLDIETWMPSRGDYGETHSSSILLDFQARRSNIRYRDENNQLQYAYTLNNTMVATPRILIPLLEHHQRPDGSIHIPQALRKYMMGYEEIRL